jgi:hypothetical protein
MSVLDKAVEHFETFGVRQIEVEEWDTTIYCTPFTLAEKKKLLKFAREDDIEFLARTLMLKALDKNGEALFDLSDKPKLMHKVDPTIITRIVNEISNAPSVEEQLGN